jgi:hypothetical protein
VHRRILVGVVACLIASTAAAQAENTVSAPAQPEAPPPWFAHANAGVPLYTSVGTWTNPSGGAMKAASFTPADRVALVQLIGFGRWVHPHIRLNLSLQFAEMVTSQPMASPAGATTYTGLSFTSAIVWAAFTYGPFFAGIGPMVGARWMGNSMKSWVYADGGVFTCLGASLKLGAGFMLGLAVQLPVTFNPAVNWGVTPAAVLARRF